MTNQAATTTSALAPDADGGFTHRQILTILSGLMLGMALAALDQTVVSTAIRTIADDLQGFELQAWATTAFLITATISTPLYGKLSDIYGRRPFYLAAITIFLVGSMLCGMAGSMYELAAFRALQGLGAGGLMSLALAILGDIVPPRQRARYQGLFLGVWATSSVVGPLVGGFLAGTDSILGVHGWRWIFYLNVPIGIAAFLVVGRVLRLPHRRQDHRIDWPGAVALVVALVPVLTIAEQGRQWGWQSDRAVACYLIGALGLVGFLLAERAYRDEALLPLRMFGNRSFAVASFGSFIVGSGMFGAIVMLPLYLQIVKGSSPTEMGVATSSVTFFRQMGGTLGAAVFLSVLFSTVTVNIASAVDDVRGTAEFQAAAAANPEDVRLLRGGSVNLNDTSFIETMDPTLAYPLKVGFSESMDLIFLVAAGVIMIGLVAVAFLPNVPLRTLSGVQARQADAEALG